MYFLHHRPNSWVLLSLLRVHPLNMCQRRPAVSSEDCAALIGPFFIWRHFFFFFFFRKCSVGVVCIMSNIHFTVILACCSPPIERCSTNRWRPLKSTKHMPYLVSPVKGILPVIHAAPFFLPLWCFSRAHYSSSLMIGHNISRCGNRTWNSTKKTNFNASGSQTSGGRQMRGEEEFSQTSYCCGTILPN